MAYSTYFKPDVEVLQEFRNRNPVVLRAELQSIIVGPAYHKMVDKKLGSYAGTSEVTLKYPSLSSGATVLNDSLAVTIKNYAGEHSIDKTVLKIESNSGRYNAAAKTFVDNNVDFSALNIVASSGPGNNDGNFVHVTVGAHAGYVEIQSVVDSHTLQLSADDNFGSVDFTDANYTIGNFGYLPTETGIILSPRLTSSGVVYISGLARRVDYSDRLLISSGIRELESTLDSTYETDNSGVSPVNLSNPLAFGMAKAMQSLGPNDVCIGLMVEDDTPASYQKALDLLETEEVYCIVPLTTNPIVHQMCSEHVTTMSKVEEKRERITLFNTERYNRIIKQGYFGRQDPITKAWDIAEGNVVASGTQLADTFAGLNTSFQADGSGVDQVFSTGGGFSKMVVLYRPGVDYTLSYALTSAPTVYIPVTVDADGKAIVDAGTGDIASVKFNSSASHTQHCECFFISQGGLPGTEQSFYPVLMPSSANMANPYYNVTAGHKTLKVRVFDKQNIAANPLLGTLPGGMTLHVTYGNGESSDVTTAGTHNFDADITKVLVTNGASIGNAVADRYIVNVLAMVNNGTYAVNTFVDTDATFLSAKIVDGEDEFVVIDRSVVDENTTSKFKETRYQVKSVVSETELTIDKVWDDEAEDFVDGEFPGISANVTYRVETPVISNKYELAAWYRDISAGFANRRATHIFAPAVGVTDDGTTIIPIPGYYFACAYAGVTQAEKPQNGFTNRPISGFVKVYFTNDYFTEAQMDVIAQGGTSIVIQSRVNAPLMVRHQLTTDMTSIETREYSVTKNLDFMAKSARNTFRPYIGRFLITPETKKTLFTVGNALKNRWLAEGNILDGTVSDFYEDASQADKLIACFYLKVPLPLNYIRLIFVI